MVSTVELHEFVAASHEWLLVRETGKTFPLNATEIEFVETQGKRHFGFIDDKGFHSWRLNDASIAGNEIVIEIARAFAKKRETMRLVPRESATKLIAEIEAARVHKANEIAQLITANYVSAKLGRVALNDDNGRLAQIEFENADKTSLAAIADVTAKLTPEIIFTAAILWVDKISLRKKKPVSEIWLICEKRQARAAQKLHALLTEFWKRRLTIIEINRKSDLPRLVELPKRIIRDLWREKPPKLVLPERVRSPHVSKGSTLEMSITAHKIIGLAPDSIDIITSRHGETLRFNGLPFARVRTIAGAEKAWFGVGRERRILSDETWDDLCELVESLDLNRSHQATNKRHKHFRIAPEAWLESILRRNIKLLDANLILSPIYNQFRFVRDKIDLLALRRDGRLVIIELKTQPDRAAVFQAADYWRKIELQRRRGVLSRSDLFEGREIADKPALVYLAAPAWSFHRDFEFFARCLSPEIELWRFELHEEWRKKVRVIARHDYDGMTNL
ncbi:MAG: hypothetical protein WBD16_05360 [Pyrinomonadaceae bacterium]